MATKSRGKPKRVPSAHERRAKKKLTAIKAKRRPSLRGKILRGKWVLPGAPIETAESMAMKQSARRGIPKDELPADPGADMPHSPTASRR